MKSACAFLTFAAFSCYTERLLGVRAQAETDAWTSVGQFYNAYQESVMKELEQRQKAKGKQRADPEEDLRTSELPEELHDAFNLARRVLSKDGSGGHNVHSHRWNEIIYKVRPPISEYLLPSHLATVT